MTVRVVTAWLVALVLLGIGGCAYAETIAATAKPAGTVTISATQGHRASGPSGTFVIYDSFGEACNAQRTYPYGVLSKGNCSDVPASQWANAQATGTCYYNNTGTNCAGMPAAQPIGNWKCPSGYTTGAGICTNSTTVYQCPTGQNWTLSGTQCTRPDCVAPQVRQTDGSCVAPCPMWSGVDDPSIPTNQPSTCQCPAGTAWNVGCRKKCTGSNAGDSANAGWDIVLPKGSTEGCWGGCGVQHVSGAYNILKDGSRAAPATYTGWACAGNGAGTATTNDGQPQPNNPAKDKAQQHEPKCAAGEGVVTVSTGKILCLPGGSDVSVPAVQTTKKVETFSDNSTKTTDTTKTTDPATGVSDVRSTVTSTGGLSGSAGTSSSVETSGSNTSGTGTGSDGNTSGNGACDPKSDFCGGPGTGGLYAKKSKTVSDVLTTFKTGMMSSSLGSAAGNFFTVSVPSGSCPAWAVDVAMLNVHLDFSQYFCTPTAVNTMNLVGAVLMFVAAFVGFRWAML